MAVSINKMAPTAVVVTMVSYCVWPYVFAAPPVLAKRVTPLPEIAAAKLTPLIMPSPQRDPFKPGDAVASAVVADRVARAIAAKHPLSPAAARAATLGTVASAAAAAVRLAAAAKTPSDPLASLVLNATSICGRERLAMINGHLYAQGERLKSLDAAMPLCTLAAVEPYKVLLDVQGKRVELVYANKRQAEQRTAPRPGGPPAKKAGPPKSPSPSGRGSG